eukprot:6195087-Pleurochrysis_carterae.AAC.1
MTERASAYQARPARAHAHFSPPRSQFPPHSDRSRQRARPAHRADALPRIDRACAACADPQITP